MVNLNKLKGKIVENGYSIEAIAVKIGINKSTFYRKMNENGDTFSIKEANAIVELLKLSSTDAAAIFFATQVA
ncbi:MAG: XRE family transcriptional regulator [Clostridiales bacterium]|jgi:transposase-like protein|nr:XRE family transcriptional regulator [Clostridiales bacterium]